MPIKRYVAALKRINWLLRTAMLCITAMFVSSCSRKPCEGKNLPIHEAIQWREMDKLARVLEENPTLVNAKNRNCETPLHMACEKADSKILRYLLERGADVNARDIGDQTPLHWAAGSDSAEFVTLLLQKGSDPNAQDNLKKRPLHMAACHGVNEVVVLLLDAGAQIDATDCHDLDALRWALFYEQNACAELLLQRGVTADIFVASALGKVDLVARHLEAKPDLAQAKDKFGETAAHWAAKRGHLDVVKMLLDKKAKVNAKNKLGETPLHSAVKVGELFKTKEEFIVAPRERNRLNNSTEVLEIVKLLIARGADVNARNVSGETPLKYANWFEDKQFAELIRNSGGKE